MDEKLTFLVVWQKQKKKIPQERYIDRLKSIRSTLHRSEFFRTHEVIGSSLLFVHDRNMASIWLIDFAKTISLPTNTEISHKNEWRVGNHEDGYLIGINNLIAIFEELVNESSNAFTQACDTSPDDDEPSSIKCTKQTARELPAHADGSTIEAPSPEINKLSITQSSKIDRDQ